MLWTNRRETRLTGAAFTFTAPCPSGDAGRSMATRSVRRLPSGDTIPTGVRLARTNAKRRFATTLLAQLPSVESYVVMLSMSLDGSRTAKSARGTIEATVTVAEAATGELRETCSIGELPWTATRRPGRVYGGPPAITSPS